MKYKHVQIREDMNSKQKQKFAIGHFYKEKTEDNKEVVELLPGVWLTDVGEKWICHWPPVEEEKKIRNWVQKEQPPEDDWLLCEDLKILCWAGTNDICFSFIFATSSGIFGVYFPFIIL